MIFLFGNKKYVAANASTIVFEMAREEQFELAGEHSVRDFLIAEVGKLADEVHPRELDFKRHLSDEALAFNYLCLLDEYSFGKLIVAATNSSFLERRQ